MVRLRSRVSNTIGFGAGGGYSQAEPGSFAIPEEGLFLAFGARKLGDPIGREIGGFRGCPPGVDPV